jgi:hypothetical protein
MATACFTLAAVGEIPSLFERVLMALARFALGLELTNSLMFEEIVFLLFPDFNILIILFYKVKSLNRIFLTPRQISPTASPLSLSPYP